MSIYTLHVAEATTEYIMAGETLATYTLTEWDLTEAHLHQYHNDICTLVQASISTYTS